MFSKIILALACAGSAAYGRHQGRYMMQMEGDAPSTGYGETAPATGYGQATYAPQQDMDYTAGQQPQQPAAPTGYGQVDYTQTGTTYEEPAYVAAEPAYGTASAGAYAAPGATGYGAATAAEPKEEKKPMILIGLIVAASIALMLLIVILVLCAVGFRFCADNKAATSFMFLQQVEDLVNSYQQ